MAKEFKVLQLILDHLPKQLHAELFQDAKDYLIEKGELILKDKDPTDNEVTKEIETWAANNKPAKTN